MRVQLPTRKSRYSGLTISATNSPKNTRPLAAGFIDNRSSDNEKVGWKGTPTQGATNQAEGSSLPVIQLGKIFDQVKKSATDDAEDNFDYDYKSVTDRDYQNAANELITEHLAAGFSGHDNKPVLHPVATPDAKGWGGAPGILYIPLRKFGLTQMLGGTFIQSLIHEVGHFVVDSAAPKSGIKDKIAPLAALAGTEASSDEHNSVSPNAEDWIEECRADLTGVYLRFSANGEKPDIDQYDYLADESADSQHPPGTFRLVLIKKLLTTL